MYVATINQPGYLPNSVDVSVTFDTEQEAWEYLLGEFEYHNGYSHPAWPTKELGTFPAADGYNYSVSVAEEESD